MTENRLSRKSFLKSCAAVGGGIALTAIAAEVATPLLFNEKMEFDENISLWALDQPFKNPPLNEDIDVDVAIVGGGYTGLSAAYYILKHFPSLSVVVLEARGVGYGGSGRNGGMLLPQTPNEYMQIYSNPQTHRLIYDITVKNMDDLADIIKTQDVDSAFRRNGVLLVIAKESQVEGYRNYVKQANALGIPVEFWDRERTKNEIGTEVYYGSLYEPNAGEVHPMKLVYALKKVAESAGAHIYEDSPVLEVQEGETIRLLVGEGKHQVIAKAMVLATNGYTSKIGYFKNSEIPVHTPMAVTHPLTPATFEEIGWKNPVAYSDTYTILYHLSRTLDNRILIGSGYVNYFFNNGVINQDDVRKLGAHLQRELIRIYPSLRGMDAEENILFEYIWTGVLGFSLDFSQSVGVMGSHHNIYYGLCFVGHGINLSTLFGKIIADLYANEETHWKAMPFLNHQFIPLPPEPLKWAGVQLIKDYYKIADSID
ncbi:MAG: FAD-dependent oxidoreductase [Anaerolineales bacterium]